MFERFKAKPPVETARSHERNVSSTELPPITEVAERLNKWSEEQVPRLEHFPLYITDMDDVDACLEGGGYTSKELNGLLQAVYNAAEATNGVVGGYPYLAKIDPSRLPELYEDPDSPIDKMFKLAVQQTHEYGTTKPKTVDASFLSLVEKVTAERYGLMDTWRQDGKVLPEYIRELADNPMFPALYAEVRIKELDESGAQNKKKWRCSVRLSLL